MKRLLFALGVCGFAALAMGNSAPPGVESVSESLATRFISAPCPGARAGSCNTDPEDCPNPVHCGYFDGVLNTSLMNIPEAVPCLGPSSSECNPCSAYRQCFSGG